MIDHIAVQIYRIWHGHFKLRGAGKLLSILAPRLSGLQKYELHLPENQTIEVDFTDVTAVYWLNHQLGDDYEEKGLLAAICQYIGVKDVFWDVGANSGLLSYNLLRSAHVGEIHMFEPNPKMSRLAGDALAPFHHVHLHPFGLSEKNESFSLTVPYGHTTMGTLEPDSTQRHGSSCKVECRIGDDLIFKDGFSPPRVIKIDTEGHELKVISGLSRTIAEFRPVIFFEHFSIDVDHAKSLMPEGYTLFTVSDSSGELIPGINPDAGHNAVFIPEQ